MRRSILIAAAFVLLSSVSISEATIRTVALSGQPAAGTPEGVTYSSFGAHFVTFGWEVYRGPVIDDNGQVAFRADLSGTGVDTANNQGIWSEGSGSLALVARTGNAAPGAPEGINFARNPALELFEPVINSVGQTAFYGGLTDGTVGIWSEGSGSLSLVARDGMQVAGAPEGVYHSFGVLRDFFPFLPLLNDVGQTAFSANLTGVGVDNTNDWAVWSEGSGSLGMITRSGSPAPGTPEGVNFDSFIPVGGFNDLGQAAFFAFVTGDGVDPTNDQGIWSGAAGSLALAARTGNPAPGTGGATFREFIPHVEINVEINDAGHTAFIAMLTGDGVDETNDSGLWSDASGTLTLVARSGSPAPGTPDGVSFAPFGINDMVSQELNNAGDIAFRGNLTGAGVAASNNQGIWLAGDDSAALVARTGDQPPGTASGVSYIYLARPTLNSSGQVAFGGVLAGTGVSTSNDMGIWATDQAGALQLIVRKGAALEVAPGDLRTVSDFGFVYDSGNSDGRASAFNDLGQLVFWAKFTNGTQGVFVSSAVAHMPGDFNNDGTVDTADYVVWRANDGTHDGYDTWRANFGRTLLTGSGSISFAQELSAAVPEPAGVFLIVAGLGVLIVPGRRRRHTCDHATNRVAITHGGTVMESLTHLSYGIGTHTSRVFERGLASHCSRMTVAVAFAACAILLQIAAITAQGAAIEFDSSRKSPAVIPFDPNAGSEASALYVSGRVPTHVKGPVRGGTNINTLVGADEFYNQGYTGANAVIANISCGHVWSGHETLTHVLQIPNHPSALNEFERHETWIGGMLAGREAGENPGPYQQGLAPDAQLYSGNISSQWGGVRPNVWFHVWNAVFYDQYRRAISTGVDGSGRTADVINGSWGSDVPNGSDNWSIGLDGFVNANPRTLLVFAAGNSGPGPNKVGRPAAAYNNMSVAALGWNPPYDRPAPFSSGGPNDYADPVNGTVYNARQVVDIAAPGMNLAAAYYGGETGGNGTTDNPAVSGPGPTGLPTGPLGGPDFYSRGGLNGTSFAAPTVAGSAALLYDAAYSVFADNADARDARVMKAVLMNSADKTVGWNNGQVANEFGGVLTTQGLDNRVGAGAMNLTTAYDQFLTGTTDIAGIASGDLGLVDEIGWDFGQVVSGTTNDYFFDSPLDEGSTFTATLTWFRDRRINTSNTVYDDSFDDLNLELWSVVDGAPASLISESASLYNESEHFSFALPFTGDYALRVRWFTEVFDRVADANQELYGLAWRTSAALAAAVPEPASTLLITIAAMAFGASRRAFRSYRPYGALALHEPVTGPSATNRGLSDVRCAGVAARREMISVAA